MLFDRKKLIADFYETLSPADKKTWLTHRKACDKSMFFFCKEVGGSVQKCGGDININLHGVIMDSWQDPKVTRQGATMPRGWRKTTTLTILGNIWEYLQNPEIRILLPSEKQDTASKWVMQMGNHLLRNERLRWLYPELSPVNEDWARNHRWSSLYLELPRNGFYPEPTIECVGIRGAAQGGHYDLIAPDDLVGEKGMESALVLEDALRWFDNIEELLIQPSMDAPDASRIRVLGTHWGPGDHIEYMVEKYPEYKWYMVSCLKHDIESSRENVVYLHNPDVGTGESNFPEGGTTDHYIAMKANPDKEMVFWAQHMNMPTGASKTTKFDYNWLRFYTIQERDEGGKVVRFVVCDDGQEFRLENITKYGLIDPGGFSETKLIKGGSRNVLFVAGQPDNSVKKFIFDVSAKRFKEPKAFMDIFFEMNDKWNVRLWKIETIAAQKYIYKDIIEEKRRRGSRVTVIPMDPDVNKAAKEGRITGLIAPCSAGEYFIHRSMKDLIGEYRSYPSGLTKDIVDMWGVYNRDFAKRRAPSDTKGAPIKPRPALLEDGPDGRSEVTGY